MRWVLVLAACAACSGKVDSTFAPAKPSPHNAGLADSPWPTFGGDVHYSRRGRFRGPQRPVVRWRVELPIPEVDLGLPAPVIGQDGTIYVAADEIVAVTASGGIRARRPGLFLDPIVTRDGSVLVRASTVTVRLSPDLGSETNVRAPFAQVHLNVGADGAIYFSGAGGFHAVERNGEPRWAINPCPATCSIRSELAIAGDGSLRAAHEGVLYAFGSDGSARWTAPSGPFDHTGRPEPAPTVLNDGSTLMFRWPELIAFDNGGREKWRIVGVKEPRPAVGADDTIYLETFDGFSAFRPDGTKKWVTSTFMKTPAVDGAGTTYGGAGRIIHAVRSDGSVMWSGELGEEYGPCALGDGVLYVVVRIVDGITRRRQLVAIGE